MSTHLPLYELFERLKADGLQLGVEEYLLLIKALHQEKYLRDLAALKRLCKMLWTKSEEEAWILDRHFRLINAAIKTDLEKIYAAQQAPSPPSSTALEPKETTTSEEDSTVLPHALDTLTETPDTNDPPPKPSRPSPSSPPPVANEAQAPSVLPSPLSAREDFAANAYLPYGRQYVATTSYAPISLRQMQQSWRFLRRWTYDGPNTLFDLKETIQDIAQKGFFQEAIYRAPKTNSIEILLLQDRGGSMVPFHRIGDEFCNSAMRGGYFGQVTIRYFHDYPIQYFYRDTGLSQAQAIPQMLHKMHPKNTRVLILSDGGAARQSYSHKRIDRWQQCLQKLGAHCNRIVWLNPIPQMRWEDCSAAIIAQQVPMFEFSHTGITQAIDVLRGIQKFKP
ncbi:MAG: hypothetical protein AAGD05_09635 [Bacteroidota bacterium]